MACIITYNGVDYSEEEFERLLVRSRFEGLYEYLPPKDEELRIVDANYMIRLTDEES